MTHSATALQQTLTARNADIGNAAYEVRQLRYAVYLGRHSGAVIQNAFVKSNERIKASYLERDQRTARVNADDERGSISDPVTGEPSP